MWVFFHLMLLLFSTNNTLTMQYGSTGRKENTPGEMSTYWVQIQLRLKLLFILLRPINSVAIRTSIDYNLLTRTDKFSGLMPSVENNILYYIITKQTLHTHNGNTSTLARAHIFLHCCSKLSREQLALVGRGNYVQSILQTMHTYSYLLSFGNFRQKITNV